MLAGEIPVGPAPTDDASTDTPAAAAARLPKLTLAAADVGQGVTAVDEGELVETGYVGYQRTFEDVVVGSSHLIRLQARTAVYETAARAAAAQKILTQAVGREIFANGIARAFGKQTAVAPSDYAAKSTTLTFNPGKVTKLFQVTVNGDTSFEPDETFTVTLSNPSGATIADGEATGTITNDD